MPEAIKRTRQEKKKKKGIAKGIILLGVIGMIVGGLYLGRAKVAPFVSEVPLLNQIFKTTSTSEDPYAGLTKEVLIAQLKASEEMLEKAKVEVQSLENETVLLMEKIDGLKKYEENYNAFITQKNQWDETLIQSNPELFKAQFETFYQDTATRLYKELKGEEVLGKEQKELAKTIGQMEAAQAASALTKLLQVDTELVKMILQNMKSDQQASILDEMESNVAAQIIKLMAPSKS